MDRIRIHAWAACAAILGTLAACASIKPVPAPAEARAARPSCTAAVTGDPVVGNWLSVSSQKGVAGALRTLYTLNPDGTMNYVEQIKRPRTPSQGLYESGCWSHEGQTLILRTLEHRSRGCLNLATGRSVSSWWSGCLPCKRAREPRVEGAAGRPELRCAALHIRAVAGLARPQ